ncbi:hypothetical protein ATO46_16445 [Aeromonas schubertii]|uniref:DUF2390 domain-containing protein n=1 Tax=Aeromonas schubertii TaxID=652 RepID=UPI00067ED6C1|nr:DUF2390 domain-containing protein [Aeromonas schubertii]KUE80039.1 hypothetical protein ATO46_16445 [Aeromonas schubertii]
MPPSNWPTVQAFWSWAAERYGRAPASWLALQQAGGSVNLALLLAWCDEAGEAAPPLDVLEAAIAPLEAVLGEFRALRRRLKAQLAECDYRALLDHELALEREQQTRLLTSAGLAPAGQLAIGGALCHYLMTLGLGPRLAEFGATRPGHLRPPH